MEIVNRLPELLPLQSIRDGRVETTLSATQHLRSYSDPTFVQYGDGNLITLPEFAQNIRFWYSNVVERQHAGSGTHNPQFILGFVDREAWSISIDDEACDSFVTLKYCKEK